MTDPKSIILKPNTPPELVGDWNLFEVQQVSELFYNQVQAQVADFLQRVTVGKPPEPKEPTAGEPVTNKDSSETPFHKIGDYSRA